MSTETHLALGVAFLLIGAAAAGLQYWLWTFPMGSDPTGKDPNGQTTAPRFWRMTHRLLGYAFVAIYLVMVASMLPRAGRYVDDAWNLNAIVHVFAALGVLLVVIPKVLILRRLQKYGKRLPLLGSLLLLFAGVIASTGATPYVRLRLSPRPAEMSQAEFDATVSHIANYCNNCHGLSVVMRENEDAKEWGEILEEMQENAREMGRPDPVQGRGAAIAAILARQGEHGGGGESHGRGRGRGGRGSN